MRLFSSIICLITLNEAWSYSDCPGVRSCQSRRPFHGYAPQTTNCPYSLYIEERHINKNTIINITLSGTITFRGFMLQALNPGHPSPIGKFHNSVGGVNFDCGLNLENAIGHYESSDKNTTTVQWEPDRMRADYVEFYATIVYNISTFWLDLKSEKIYVTDNTGSGYGRMGGSYQRRNDTYYRNPFTNKYFW